MTHEGYIRDDGTHKVTVILIHGILSTPRHFDWLISQLPDSLGVYNLLLAGHGGKVQDFTKATMDRWKQQLEECIALQEKAGRRIVLVGHSLGALLALNAAGKHQSVSHLFLLNVPLHPFVKPVMVKRGLRFAFGKLNMQDPLELRCYRDLSISLEPKLWKYLGWIPNFISLLRLASQCRRIPGELKIPILAVLGQKDELVSMRTARWLENKPHIRLLTLPEGGHFGYTEQEQQRLIAAFLENCVESNDLPSEAEK